ncbi:MAG: YcxB family protein [Phycisphaeraceae bacterium]
MQIHSPVIQAEGVPVARDQWLAHWLYMRPRSRDEWGMALLKYIALPPIGVFLVSTGSVTTGLIVLICWGMWCYVAVVERAIWYVRARRVNPDPIHHIQYTFDHEAMAFQTRWIEARMKWPSFASYRFSHQIVLLYRDDNEYQVISRRYFANDEQWLQFRLLVKRSLGKCDKCGYLLCGSASDACPECGHPLLPEG